MEEQIRKMLTGRGRGILAWLSRQTGISDQCLSYYKKNPDSIPLRCAVAIANALELSADDWNKLREVKN